MLGFRQIGGQYISIRIRDSSAGLLEMEAGPQAFSRDLVGQLGGLSIGAEPHAPNSAHQLVQGAAGGQFVSGMEMRVAAQMPEMRYCPGHWLPEKYDGPYI